MESENLRGIIEGMMKSTVERAVALHTQEEIEEDWNIKGLVDYLNTNLLQEGDVKRRRITSPCSRGNERANYREINRALQ